MALDPRYITSVELQSYFVDKTTGLPLAGGLVYFYSDNNRNSLKNVYQLSGSPPNYTYTALANPLTLSGVGTFQDNTGDDIAVYYFPFDAFGNIENYYIAVYEPASPPPFGTPQFTREAWPNETAASITPVTASTSSATNALSNPQFAEILFDPSAPLVLNVPGGPGTTTFQIAPDWEVIATASVNSTITITQVANTGSTERETNFPYSLTVQTGAGITLCKLRQKLPHDPGLWARTSATNGWLSGSIVLGPGSPALSILYTPSTGTEQTILFADNTAGGNWTRFQRTVQLIPSDNTDSANTGFVYITILLPLGTISSFSSVQVVPFDTNVASVPYDQSSVNRQIDQLFHYYQPQLNYKPIPSYLVGWDFPLNPAQINGDAVGASAVGVNKSYYAWDQTIVFQTVNSSVAVSRAGNGGITLTQAIDGQEALIQYLGPQQAKELLQGNISVALSGSCNKLAGIVGTVSLWATTDANLPDLKSANYLSLVSALDANGHPTCGNGNWTEVTRSSLGNAKFTLGQTETKFSFNGWNLAGNALQTTATYFAIVVGFSAMTTTTPDALSLTWLGLNAGDIATRPAPKTPDEALRDCEQYYEMSYVNFAAVGTATITNAVLIPQAYQYPAGNASAPYLPSGFYFENRTLKRVTNPNITIYSGDAGTPANFTLRTVAGPNYSEDILVSRWTINPGSKSVNFTIAANSLTPTHVCDTTTTTPLGYLVFHYISDARFGIVL